MKEISCIYEIKNIINRHRYIGQTKNFYTRKRKHMNGLKKNKHNRYNISMPIKSQTNILK